MEKVSVFKAVSMSNAEYPMCYNSAFVWEPVGRLRYCVGEWTRATPPMVEIGYHPTVFIEEGAARLFVEQAMPVRLHLFRATGRGKIAELPQRGYVCPGPNPVQLYSDRMAEWPYGTAMFEEVRLDSFYGFVNYKPFRQYCWVHELPIA